MKVAELLEQLRKAPQEAMVVLSRDSEGNGFSPVDNDWSVGWYHADTDWSGEFHTEPDPEDLEEDEEPWDYTTDPDYEQAVCLWPRN